MVAGSFSYRPDLDLDKPVFVLAGKPLTAGGSVHTRHDLCTLRGQNLMFHAQLSGTPLESGNQRLTH